MADEDAPPSKLASFFRTLLCAIGSVKWSKNEGSVCPVVKATKPKGAWTQKSDHDLKWTNVVLNQMCTSGDGSDKCRTSSSPASGEAQRHLECFVSPSKPSVQSDINEPADIQVSLSFSGSSILGAKPSSPRNKQLAPFQQPAFLFKRSQPCVDGKSLVPGGVSKASMAADSCSQPSSSE
eukprot:gene4048-14131_t